MVLATNDKTFKSPDYKLLSFFHRSRDGWKAKAQQRNLRIKRLKNKVAAMRESRRKWKEGYHARAAEELEQVLLPLAWTPASLRMRAALVTFVAEQDKDLTEGQHVLGSSEVLESLLGKYKRIQGTHSKGGMTGSPLSIGAAVLEKSATAIQTAMATVPVAAIGQWVRDNLGLTIPAQQAFAFQRNKTGPNNLTTPQPSF